jgi:hypothetical protein
MTHDELFTQLQYDRPERFNEYAAALRAVVELHKPFKYEGRFGSFLRCSGCSSEEEWQGSVYPCPTIQAIEKELQ